MSARAISGEKAMKQKQGQSNVERLTATIKKSKPETHVFVAWRKVMDERLPIFGKTYAAQANPSAYQLAVELADYEANYPQATLLFPVVRVCYCKIEPDEPTLSWQGIGPFFQWLLSKLSISMAVPLRSGK
jgi:hypothetical protein